MLQLTADLWSPSLIYEDQALEMFKKWGYYQQKLRVGGQIIEKARVIYMNTQACYLMNAFLQKLRNDPGDQL